MSIISKETWDKFTQEEKQKIREIYKATKEEEHRSSRERNAVLSLMVDRYEELFGKENIQPQPLTYSAIIKELFKDGAWQVAGREYPREFIFNDDANDHYFLNCTSEQQGNKLLAINRMLNVARFLNGKDWKPDEEDGKLWTIGIEKYNKTIMPVEVGAYDYRTEIVYFPTQKLTQQAIQILGEDTVRLALSLDW